MRLGCEAARLIEHRIRPYRGEWFAYSGVHVQQVGHGSAQVPESGQAVVRLQQDRHVSPYSSASRWFASRVPELTKTSCELCPRIVLSDPSELGRDELAEPTARAPANDKGATALPDVGRDVEAGEIGQVEVADAAAHRYARCPHRLWRNRHRGTVVNNRMLLCQCVQAEKDAPLLLDHLYEDDPCPKLGRQEQAQYDHERYPDTGVDDPLSADLIGAQPARPNGSHWAVPTTTSLRHAGE